jgi:hypothetical protein
MGDWKIGDDRRRRSTDQLRSFREANEGQVEWDTEAPADFTYVYHPDRVLVRAADVDEFDRAVASLDEGILKDPPQRDDVRLLDGELVRYLLPERAGGQSVGDLLDLLEGRGLRPGAASPDHWVHVSPGGPGALCPAVEPEETGLKEPWPPQVPQRKKSCDVSVVVVDTGWNPPSGTDPRTPWLDDIFRRETIYGSLLLTWRRGVIESAVMRQRRQYDRFDLAHFRLLVQSRVGQFLRHLTIEDTNPSLAEGLAELEELPPTLETLNLGYQLGPRLSSYPAPEKLKQRCPRLRDASVFFTTPGLKLKGEKQTVVLLRPCRFIRTDDGSLILGEEERLPSLASFAIREGCFWFSGDFAGTTQLNARSASGPIRLMLGDEISLRTGHRFRVEPNDTDDHQYEEPAREPEPETEEREWGGAL